MRVLLGLATAAAVGVSIPLAHAEEWCGFLNKEHAQVHCGYSSLAECQQSIGDKGAICIPDPSFASRRSGTQVRIAAIRSRG